MKLSDLLHKLNNDSSLRSGQQYVQGIEGIEGLLTQLHYDGWDKYGGLGIKKNNTAKKDQRKGGESDGSSQNSEGETASPSTDAPVQAPFALSVCSSKLQRIDRLGDGGWVRSCFPAGAHGREPPHCVVLLARINDIQDLDFCSSSPELRLLDVSHNYLVDIEGAGHCTRLRHLDCSGNLLRRVSFGEKTVSNLTILRLSHNKISSLQGLAACLNLRDLDLSHNRLCGDIEERLLPASLQVLDLSDNRICGVAGLSTSPLLNSLNLARNDLKAVEHFEQLLFLCKLLPELRQLDIRGNQVYEAEPAGDAGDGDIESGGQASRRWREQQSLKRRTRHFFEIIAVAGGEEGLSLFNGKVILPTTKGEVKNFRSVSHVEDVVTDTTNHFMEIIKGVESERDAKLEALERQRQEIITGYSHSIEGVHAEMQRTIEFLQALKDPDHDEAVQYARDLIDSSVAKARERGWRGFTKEAVEKAANEAEEQDNDDAEFLEKFLAEEGDAASGAAGGRTAAGLSTTAEDAAREKAHAQLVRMGVLKGNFKKLAKAGAMLRKLKGKTSSRDESLSSHMQHQGTAATQGTMAILAHTLSTASMAHYGSRPEEEQAADDDDREQSSSRHSSVAVSTGYSRMQSVPGETTGFSPKAPATSSLSQTGAASSAAAQVTDEERRRAHEQLVRKGILKGTLQAAVRRSGMIVGALQSARGQSAADDNTSEDIRKTGLAMAGASVVRGRLEGAVAAGRQQQQQQQRQEQPLVHHHTDAHGFDF